MNQEQKSKWEEVQAAVKQVYALRSEYLDLFSYMVGRYVQTDYGTSYQVTGIKYASDRISQNQITLLCRRLNSKGEGVGRVTNLPWYQLTISDTPFPVSQFESKSIPSVDDALKGRIILGSNGEESDILFVGSDDGSPFAEVLQELIQEHGNMLTVRYWISDVPLSKESLTEMYLQTLLGLSKSEYDVHFSDYTGYLWTDEALTVGGHDLLAELKSHEGKYLAMEIDFDFG